MRLNFTNHDREEMIRKDGPREIAPRASRSLLPRSGGDLFGPRAAIKLKLSRLLKASAISTGQSMLEPRITLGEKKKIDC